MSNLQPGATQAQTDAWTAMAACADSERRLGVVLGLLRESTATLERYVVAAEMAGEEPFGHRQAAQDRALVNKCKRVAFAPPDSDVLGELAERRSGRV